MRRTAIIAIGLAAALAAALLLVHRAAPAAPSGRSLPAAAAPPAAGGDLPAMLAAGRRARLQRTVATPAERRRALDDALAHGGVDARRGALRTLALDDRPAADAIARGRLADPVLFADAARLLLVRPGGAPASADVRLVRRELRTGRHDEASRRTVAALVLDTLEQHDSPAAAGFAVTVARR